MNNDKPNDWLVSIALNDNSGPADFQKAGLTAENTQLKDRDFYKGSKFVQDNFKNPDGSFDENGFNNLYNQASESFQVFANNSFDKNKLEEIEYSFSNVFRPTESNIANNKFEVKKIQNPFKEKIGVMGIGTYTENDMSLSEIAQQNKVIDYKTGETLDWSPNDMGGLAGFFREPLVLAEWDEDGYHLDDSGKKVPHKKGDIKYNSDGEVCYETLGDRDASTKNFLSSFDTVTTDGSVWNKVDIFDADDKDQGIAKTIARAALKYAPVAIGAMAGGVFATGATVYLGATALLNLSEALPNLYKAVEGIVPGIDDDAPKTGMWRAMNTLQAKTKRWKTGTSEYSQKNMFTWENTINMIADISLQLGQQTTIAQIPKYLGLDKSYFKGASNFNDLQERITKFNEGSKQLATAYMVITSGADAYGTAKEAGHSDRAAGLITLGTLAGLHKVMNSPIGDWALKGIGLDDLRMSAKPILKDISEKWASTYGKLPGTTTSNNKVIKEIGEKLFSGVKKFIDDPSKLPAAMISEAAEEISEEIVTDFNMAMGAAAGAMGVTRKVNYEFDLGDTLKRYAMSGFGGAVGGGIHRIRTPWVRTHNALAEGGDDKKLVQHLVEHGVEGTIKVIEDEYRKGNLAGNKNFSTRYDEQTKEAGKVNFLSAENEEDSQAWAIKEGLIDLVKTYDSILTNSGVNSLDSDIRQALVLKDDPTLNELLTLGLENRIATHLEHYNSKIISLNAKLAELGQDSTTLSEVNRELTAVKLERQKIINGEHFDHYLQQGMIWMDPTARQMFLNATKNDFSLAKTGKEYNSLSDTEKVEIDNKYAEYSNNQKDMQLEYAVDVLNYYQDKLSSDVSKYDANYKQSRIAAFKALDQSMQVADKMLDVFDENGNPDPAKLALFESMGSDINGLILGDRSIMEKIQQNPGLAEHYEMEGVINTIQQLTQAGVPIDSEIADVITKYRDSKSLEVDKYFNKIFQTANGSPLSQTDGIFVKDLPVLKQLYKIKDAHKIDFNKLKKDIKDLSDDDILANIDDMDELLDYLNYDLDENDSGYDENKAIEKVKSEMINHLDLLKSQLETTHQSKLEFLKNSENVLKSSVPNPIYSYLDKVGKLNGSNNTGILDTLKQESLKLSNTSTTDYLLSNPGGLEQTLEDIKVAEVLIRMSMDSQDKGGYVNVLNKYRQKAGSTLPQLPVIPPETAIAMGRDLEILKNKINFLLKLSNYNQADRLREHRKAAGNFLQKFSELYSLDPSNPGLFAKIAADLDPDISLVEGIGDIMISPEMIDNINALQNLLKQEVNTDVKAETLAKAEIALTALEDKIYENFQLILAKNKGKEKELMKRFINPKYFNMKKGDFESIVETKTSDISSKTDFLKDNDKLIYMITIFGSKASEYKHKLYTALTEQIVVNGTQEDKFKYAPLFAQEYPCRIAYANAINPELFNGMLDCLVDSNGDLYYPILKNLTYINGYHGTGKTSATGNIIYSILKQTFGDDITISSIVDRQAEKLKESLGTSDKSFNKNELLSEITQNRSVDEFIDSSKDYKTPGYVLKSELQTIANNSKIKQFIFIDEGTHYNEKELAFLSEWCELTGRKLIVFGDDLQEGAGKDISYFATIKSPTLEFSMRSGSSTTKDNADALRRLTKEINELDYTPAKKATIPKVFASIFNTLKLKYSIDSNNLLVGSKFINKGSHIADIESYLKNIDSNKIDMKSVGIIYESNQQSDFKELEGLATKFGAQLVKSSEMQGSEFQYSVISVNITPPVGDDPDAIVKYCKKINTLFSRAQRGTLAVDTGALISKNEVDPYPTDLIKNSKEYDQKVQQFKIDRLVPLEQISKEYLKANPSVPNANNPVNPGNTVGNNPPKPQVSSSMDTGISEEIDSLLAGDVSDSEESTKREKIYLVRGKGREFEDGIALGYTSYTNFGGKYNEHGEVIIPLINSKMPYSMDLAGLAHMSVEENGEDVAVQVGDYEVYENIDGEGNVENKVLFQRYDLFKRTIVSKGPGTKIRDIVNEFKDLIGPAESEYNWDDVEYRLLYTKYDGEFDRNFEVKGADSWDSPYVKRIILHVPGLGQNDDLAITLGFVGDKNNDPNKVNDKYVLEKDDIAFNALKTQSYFEYVLEENDIEFTGVSTRIIGGKDKNGNPKIQREYTMEELRNDLSWKNMSKPMLFTGHTSHAKFLANAQNNEELGDAIDKIIQDYNLSGRPVMFISRDPRTKDWTSDQLANYFWSQKVNQAESEIDINTPTIDNMVSMVVLDTKAISVLDYFKEFDAALDLFKVEGKEAKETAKGFINTLSHKYMGLSIIRGIYEAHDYLIKKKDKDSREKAIMINLSNLKKFFEMYFGLIPAVVTINGKQQIHVAFGDTLNPKLINPNNDAQLNSAIDLIKSANVTEDKDIRNILYTEYYSKMTSVSGNLNFNFQDIITCILDLAKENSVLRGNPDFKTDVNSNYILSNLQYVLEGKVEMGKKGEPKTTYTFPGARFKNGIELHPTTQSSKNDQSGRSTNFVESSNNSEGDYIVKNKIIDSQRLTINYLNLETPEKRKESKRKKQEQLEKDRISLIDKIQKINLNPAVKQKLIDIAKNMKSITASEIDTEMNKILSNQQLTSLNSGISDDPTIAVKFENGFAKEVKMSELEDVKKIVSSGYKMQPVNTSSNEPTITFKNDSGDIKLATYKNGVITVTASNKKPGEQLTEFEEKVKQYESDIEDFINKSIPDPVIKDLIRKILLDQVGSNPNSIITFDEMSKCVNALKADQDSKYKEFSKLINQKLEIIC